MENCYMSLSVRNTLHSQCQEKNPTIHLLLLRWPKLPDLAVFNTHSTALVTLPLRESSFQHLAPAAKMAFLLLPAENYAIRFGSADAHPGHFALLQ